MIIIDTLKSIVTKINSFHTCINYVIFSNAGLKFISDSEKTTCT